MRIVRVPLAVDAQIRVPFGPMLLPLRAVLLMGAASPLALLGMNAGSLNASFRVAVALTVLSVAFTVALPLREGVWVGTWLLYRHLARLLPASVLADAGRRRSQSNLAGAVRITSVPRWRSLARTPLPTRLATPPVFTTADPGVLVLRPGGARAVLGVDGPASSVAADGYAQWCSRTVTWLLSLDCPVQLLALVSHVDSRRARIAFDRRTQAWPRTPLAKLERALAAHIADETLAIRHYVVLAPGLAPADGIPFQSRVTRAHRAVEADRDDALRALQAALRSAPAAGLSVSVASAENIADLVGATAFGNPTSMATREGVLHVGDERQVILTATQLPPVTHAGALIDALIRTRSQGVASVHLIPVSASVARRALTRRVAMQRYTAREGNQDVDNQVALADTNTMLASLAQRTITPCRVALTVAVTATGTERVRDSAERLTGALRGQGFAISTVSAPGLIPAMAAAPGGAPLGRSLQLTSDDVAACLLPVMGTPFADSAQPLMGISEYTGAPVYLSVWERSNHNALVVGTSGAGKSVAAKTLLARHVMEGASCVVIDPDSEYRALMRALGGTHLELGDDALNPLAAGLTAAPDVAAGLVLPVLSVMAGDEKGVRDGRPIRRLPDEDQGWLYAETAAFFRGWPRTGSEPLMRDLVAFIDTQSAARALTEREQLRCRVITARLRRFTQGDRAGIFDRPSTFAVGDAPVAIGLRAFAMTYAADLTPALAVVLTGVLAALGRGVSRLLVVVDEAHRVTADPDAGDVLGLLVRQARKYRAGVWMCSQRVEDFVATDLGRTLAATAATKLVLGAEEATLAAITETFALSDEEQSAINPAVPGRCVLISGSERTVARVVPGPALLSVAQTGDSTARWLPADSAAA